MLRCQYIHTMILLVCLITQSAAMGHSGNRTSDDPVGSSWSLQVLYGETATLICEDQDFRIADQPEARLQWLFPNGDIVDPAFPPRGVSFHNNNSVLVVSEVEKSDFGIYVCLASLFPYTAVRHAIKRGINVDGPFFGDLYTKYEPKMKIGLYAGLVMCAIMCIVCFNMDQTQGRLDIQGPRSKAYQSYHGDKSQSYSNGHNIEMVHHNSALDDQQNSHVKSEAVEDTNNMVDVCETSIEDENDPENQVHDNPVFETEVTQELSEDCARPINDDAAGDHSTSF